MRIRTKIIGTAKFGMICINILNVMKAAAAATLAVPLDVKKNEKGPICC